MGTFDFSSSKNNNNSNFNKSELIELAKTLYHENNRDYLIVKKILIANGVKSDLSNSIIENLKTLNSKEIKDFDDELKSRGIENIEFSPNSTNKNTTTKEEVDKYIGYGAFQIDRGNFTNALELLDKAIELDDKATLAYANKGTLYSKQGDMHKAVYFFDKALEFGPENIKIHESKITCMLEILPTIAQHKFIESLKDCLKIDKSNFMANIYSIQYYLQMNDINNSLKSLKIILPEHYSDDLLFHYLQHTFALINDKDIALKEFDKLEEGLNTSGKYRLNYFRALYLKEIMDYEESIELFVRLNNMKVFSWNYYQIAIIKNLQHKIDECLFFLAKTFELDPNLKADAAEFPELENLRYNSKFIELIS